MKLSVIICVYNTDEAYFEKCLESLTLNTLPRDEYEICVVDDGSTLDYSHLVQKYNLKYKKTENRGILRARLEGVAMAEGEYLAFCDSDDTVSVNFYAPMLDRAEKTGADIVFNDWAFHTDRVRYVCTLDETVSRNLDFGGEDVLRAFLGVRGRQHSYFVLWNKIYKKEVLEYSRSECLKYIEEGERYNYSEDALINFFAFSYSKSMSNVHTGYYFYRIHTGQTVNVISHQRLESHIKYMSRTLEIMRNNVNNKLHSEEMLANVNAWAALMSRTHYTYAKSLGYSDLFELIKSSYVVGELKKSTRRDGSVYSRALVLPDNFADIDRELIAVIRLSGQRSVEPVGLSDYSKATLDFAIAKGKSIVYKEGAGIQISRPRTSIIKRILHNYYVYNLGIVLFPKGSKIRAFLKKML